MFLIRVFLSICLILIPHSASGALRTHTPVPMQKIFKVRCERLGGIIQEIAQRIHANTLRTSDNKAFLVWLISLQIELKELLKSESMPHNRLFNEHARITRAVLTAITQEFKALPPTHKAITETAGITEEDAYELDSELVGELEKKMETLGLSSLNLAYRSLYTKATHVAIEHALALKIAKFTAYAGAFYGLHKLIHKNTSNATPQTTQAASPAQQHTTPQTQKIRVFLDRVSMSPSTIGLLHQINEYCGGLKVLDTALIAGTGYQAAKSVYSAAEELRIPHTAYQITQSAHKRLWGNSYIHQPRIEKEESRLTLDDPLFAQQPQTKKLQEIALSLTKAEEFANAGIKRPKAYLLAGPSGCGKSFSVKALYGTVEKLNKSGLRVQFVHLKSKDFEHPHIIKRLKAIITENAPCIIFIDELHLFGYGMQAESNKVLLRHFLLFLDELDLSTNPQKQAIIIGATNRLDLLDKALLRQGRFETIYFQKPHFEQRKALFTTLCEQAALTVDPEIIIRVALATQGCSTSEINKVFEEAAFQAKKDGKCIDLYLYAALNSVVRKLEKIDHLSPEEQARIAAHQAGKVIAHRAVSPRDQLESVTTLAYPKEIHEQYDRDVKSAKYDITSNYTSRFGALFSYTNNETVTEAAPSDMLKMVKILLAGSAAQKILLGESTNFGSEDTQKALQLLIALELPGVSFDDLATEQQQTIKINAVKKLAVYQEEIETLLRDQKTALAALFNALQAQSFLTNQEIEAAIQKTE